MKKLILAVSVVVPSLMSVPASAQSGVVSECASFGELAAMVMNARQDGFKFQDVIRSMENSVKDLDDDEKRMYKNIVIRAYNEPKYTTPEFKAEAVSSFEETHTMACINSSMK